MLHQKVLFTKEEIHKIRGYVTKLEDRVIGTYHPDMNDGKHDPKGGHNLAEHLPWSSSNKYNWINVIVKYNIIFRFQSSRHYIAIQKQW